MNKSKIFFNGLISKNAPLLMVLGIIPVLAVTNSLTNAFMMGLVLLFTLVITNLLISAARNIIPDNIKVPVILITVAVVVTLITLLMNALAYSSVQVLGIYLSLVAVNYVVLARAENYALKNGAVNSLLDGLGTGLGLLLGICVLALCRELLGTGAIVITNISNGSVITTLRLFPKDYAISMLENDPSGALITLGLLFALVNFIVGKVSERKNRKQEVVETSKEGA